MIIKKLAIRVTILAQLSKRQKNLIKSFKHFALNLLQQAKAKKESIKMLRAAAGWNKNTLLKILAKIKDF